MPMRTRFTSSRCVYIYYLLHYILLCVCVKYMRVVLSSSSSSSSSRGRRLSWQPLSIRTNGLDEIIYYYYIYYDNITYIRVYTRARVCISVHMYKYFIVFRYSPWQGRLLLLLLVLLLSAPILHRESARTANAHGVYNFDHRRRRRRNNKIEYGMR